MSLQQLDVNEYSLSIKLFTSEGGQQTSESVHSARRARSSRRTYVEGDQHVPQIRRQVQPMVCFSICHRQSSEYKLVGFK